ncbi:MAG: efflux RND transporter periplasmic adaptor subunit [Deltaproteobacteria bacterium]|nr:efflux RND transporter periplasmic adaptor subunit [Deltaproteobacteria bacterium]
MKRFLFGVVILLLLICTFTAGSLFSKRDGGKDVNQGGRRILFYADPMNPAHTSDKPGIAPCGMNMEPVYVDEGTPQQMARGASSAMPPGTVRVSPEKQQVIGVKTAVVEKAAVHRVMRTVGRVATDETRVYRLNAAVDGWIRETYGNSTGSLVNKDERLASYYAPELLSAEQAYIYALSSLDRFQASSKEIPAQINQTSINFQQYVDSLSNLGMSDLQIEEIARTKQYTKNIYITAPATGFIIARNVSVGQRFEKGAELYRIADLSRVWVLADFFRNETEYVKPGMKVRVIVPHQKKELQAIVSNVLPQFDATSRTLKVRLEMENHGYLLKPDMFVDVEFPVQLPAAITVPVDAVICSGLRNTVFVDRGNGFFEPRQVETGWRLDSQMEITRGLMEGERIVVSGTFLIDSESRMKAAAAGMYAAADAPQTTQRAMDPVCGMEVDIASATAAGRMLEYRGKTYYFCKMNECKVSFQKGPEQYLSESRMKAAADAPQTPQRAMDPVCGMEVDITSATAAGRMLEYRGKTYYFCRNECKVSFQNGPEQYLKE